MPRSKKEKFLSGLLEKLGKDAEQVLQEGKLLKKKVLDDPGMNLSLLETLYYSGRINRKNLLALKSFAEKRKSDFAFVFPIELKHEILERSSLLDLAVDKQVLDKEEREQVEACRQKLSTYSLQIPAGSLAYKLNLLDRHDLSILEEREGSKDEDPENDVVSRALENVDFVEEPKQQQSKNENAGLQRVLIVAGILLAFGMLVSINFIGEENNKAQKQTRTSRSTDSTESADQQEQTPGKTKNNSSQSDDKKKKKTVQTPIKEIPLHTIQIDKTTRGRFYFRGRGTLPFSREFNSKLTVQLITQGRTLHGTEHQVEPGEDHTFRFSFGSYSPPGKVIEGAEASRAIPPGIYIVQVTVPEGGPGLPDSIRLSLTDEFEDETLSPFVDSKRWKIYYLKQLGNARMIQNFNERWVQFFNELKKDLLEIIDPWRTSILSNYKAKKNRGNSFSPDHDLYKETFSSVKKRSKKGLEQLKNLESQFQILPFLDGRRYVRDLLKKLPLRIVEYSWQFYKATDESVPSWIRQRVGGGGLKRNLPQVIEEIEQKIRRINSRIPSKNAYSSPNNHITEFYRSRIHKLLQVQQILDHIVTSPTDEVFPVLQDGNFNRIKALKTLLDRYLSLSKITFEAAPVAKKQSRDPFVSFVNQLKHHVHTRLKSVIEQQNLTPPQSLFPDQEEPASNSSLEKLKQELGLPSPNETMPCRICPEAP